MGIPLGGANFTRGAAIPLDDSFIMADLTARDAIQAGIRYEGMLVYVTSEQTMFQLQGGIDNVNWTEAGGGGDAIVTTKVPYVGDGITNTFPLGVDPGSKDNVTVMLDALIMHPDAYEVVGTDIVFDEVVANGLKGFVLVGSMSAMNIPGTNSVTNNKIAPEAVTADKIHPSVGYFRTGDLKPTLQSSEVGWVLMDDGTIGVDYSGASSRAHSDTEDLFTFLWTAFPDVICPVLPSGRGASPAADFAAGKTIKLTKMLGHALGVAGAGAGLTNRLLATQVGAETHSLTEAQMPRHTHIQNAHAHGLVGFNASLIDGGPSGGFINAGGTINTNNATATNQYTGGDGGLGQAAGNGLAHNNMQPTTWINVLIKL